MLQGKGVVAVTAKTNNGHNNVIVTLPPKTKAISSHKQPFVLPVAPIWRGSTPFWWIPQQPNFHLPLLEKHPLYSKRQDPRFLKPPNLLLTDFPRRWGNGPIYPRFTLQGTKNEACPPTQTDCLAHEDLSLAPHQLWSVLGNSNSIVKASPLIMNN